MATPPVSHTPTELPVVRTTTVRARLRRPRAARVAWLVADVLAFAACAAACLHALT